MLAGPEEALCAMSRLATDSGVYFVQTGFRFSRNAATPSRKSAVPRACALISNAASVAASSHALFCAAIRRLVAFMGHRTVRNENICQRLNALRQLLLRHNLIHQPQPPRLFRIEEPACQQQVTAALVSNLQSQKSRYHRGHKADPRLGESEFRRRRGQSKVANHGQPGAARDRRSMHRSDGRNRQLVERQEESLRFAPRRRDARLLSCPASPAMPINPGRNKTPGPRQRTPAPGNRLPQHLPLRQSTPSASRESSRCAARAD